MGSGDWFKTIVCRKKSKREKSKLAKPAGQLFNGIRATNQKSNGALSSGDPGDRAAIEDLAATRIQTAFRRYKARKTLRCLKGIKRLRIVGKANPVKKQTTATLSYIQSWNRLQAEIRNRRAFMVTEGRNRQKKQENQIKLDAKLHDLQVEWNGGSETMDEILARIHQREEAAVKRERAMAYAFSHQWRAKSAFGQGQFNYEVGKGGWGWSWMDRWIAARPWEPRVLIHPENPKNGQAKTGGAKANIIAANQSALKLQGSIKLSTLHEGKDSKKKSTIAIDQKKVSKEPKAKASDISRVKSKNGTVNQEKQLPSLTA